MRTLPAQRRASSGPLRGRRGRRIGSAAADRIENLAVALHRLFGPGRGRDRRRRVEAPDQLQRRGVINRGWSGKGNVTGGQWLERGEKGAGGNAGPFAFHRPAKDAVSAHCGNATLAASTAGGAHAWGERGGPESINSRSRSNHTSLCLKPGKLALRPLGFGSTKTLAPQSSSVLAPAPEPAASVPSLRKNSR